MGDILSEVQRWRAKADELRVCATTLSNAVARDSLEEMADRYDQLANKLEGPEAENRIKTSTIRKLIRNYPGSGPSG